MKILITGASSYVGARIYFDLMNKHDLTGTYAHNRLSSLFHELDITDVRAVKSFVNTYKPEIIIHAQANANARWCEANPEEAVRINEVATSHIVDAANDIGSKIIYISSFAAIDPKILYGKTKLASEELVKGSDAGYLILRPSFILGFSPNTSNDRPFNRLLKNLLEHTPAVYDMSWKFHPTYVHHISEVVLSCIDQSVWNTNLPVVVPEVKTRFDTARDILSPFGIDVQSIDNHDLTPNQPYDTQALSRLGLPEYTYDQMVSEIVNEIRHREQFTLP